MKLDVYWFDDKTQKAVKETLVEVDGHRAVFEDGNWNPVSIVFFTEEQCLEHGRVNCGNGRHWLVWSNEHAAWWGPDRSGYFTSVDSAGRYTLREALDCCGTRDTEGRLPGELVQPSPELLTLVGARPDEIAVSLPGRPTEETLRGLA